MILLVLGFGVTIVAMPFMWWERRCTVCYCGGACGHLETGSYCIYVASKDDKIIPEVHNFCYQGPWQSVHGMEYAFGAHDYPTSGVFQVEPKSCPGFVYRQSVLLGTTDMSPTEFRCFIEQLSGKYHGVTYHLIAKNCNHFTDDVCTRLTGKPIPGWVNRLARLGSFCNCLLPESIKVHAIRHLPDNPAFSDGSESYASTFEESDEDGSGRHLLATPVSDLPQSREKTFRLARDVL
ncbi:hypothetical protein HPP92_014910 [Vanilla planifolia]|uniref:PPPDE domain-containing protein n=1 Tax=Vanilla planifolia TaxID=51239 RepID=A0A835QK74_VANPL|nr:hypothetical protein HPP92_014910 [Vanilla planifolia]